MKYGGADSALSQLHSNKAPPPYYLVGFHPFPAISHAEHNSDHFSHLQPCPTPPATHRLPPVGTLPPSPAYHGQMLRAEAGTAVARSLIAEGDLVIAYESWDSMRAVRIAHGSSFCNKYGTFQLQSWIGQPYGARISASGGRGGWVVALRPTPELWTAVLRHRTQILYVADISLAIALMELRPGSTVLESGTGSGSMTTSLARVVAPHGHVHTFEFHEQRAALAAREFVDNGLGRLVTVEHRNVEADGFPSVLAGAADAVFLDLPAPWRVVPAASKCLRPDGVACTFSPCIEQVQRTCKELNAHGFRNLRIMEVLLRQYDVLTEQQTTDGSLLLPATARSEGLDGCGIKRQLTGDDAAAAPMLTGNVMADETQLAKKLSGNGSKSLRAPAQQKRVLCRPVAEGRGHTGYLTFARKSVAP